MEGSHSGAFPGMRLIDRMAWPLRYLQPYVDGGKRVLDAGCKESPYFHTDERGFNLKWRPGQVVSVDLDAWAHPDMVQADICHLPFSDRAFDLVLCTEVYEHLTRPEDAVRELARVCRGIIVGTTPNHSLYTDDQLGHLREHSDEWPRPWFDYKILRAVPEDVMPHYAHIQWVTEAGLRRNLETAGGKVFIEPCKGPHYETWKGSYYFGFVVKL